MMCIQHFVISSLLQIADTRLIPNEGITVSFCFIFLGKQLTTTFENLYQMKKEEKKQEHEENKQIIAQYKKD